MAIPQRPDADGRFETPIFLFAGRHDYTTPSPVAVERLEGVRAPKKGVVWFEHSAHLIPVEEPGRVLHALVEKVRPVAVKSGDGEKP
jgi:pimeloyl-ACP methyl ester carboxylesterase